MGEIEPTWFKLAIGRLDCLGEPGVVDQRLALPIVQQQIGVVGRSAPSVAENEGGPAKEPNVARAGQVPVERSQYQRRAALHTDSFVAGRRSRREPS
jgi:hypothetical protein